MKSPKLIEKWIRRLPPAARQALPTLLNFADAAGLPVYLVGGPLRDLILERPSLDLDLTVQGDAPALARRLAGALGARALVHAAFGTAVLSGERFTIDLATARSEVYERPGALPRVRLASIEADLLRRDFTINAMALLLNGDKRGTLLDPAGGRLDLRAGLVRVLYEGSFRDDATRILRAARYETRFAFRIEERTLGWLKRDKRHLAAISGPRLRREFERLFREAQPEGTLLRLQGLAVLTEVHPALSFSQAQATAFADLRRLSPGAAPLACWPLLALGLPERQAASLCSRLSLTKQQAAPLTAMPRLERLAERLAQPCLKRSEVFNMLEAFPPAALWALAAATGPPARERCLDYLRRLRYLKPAIRGDALLALGVPSGPPVGQLLRRLRAAKLDGDVRSRADEERFIRSLMADAVTRHGG